MSRWYCDRCFTTLPGFEFAATAHYYVTVVSDRATATQWRCNMCRRCAGEIVGEYRRDGDGTVTLGQVRPGQNRSGV